MKIRNRQIFKMHAELCKVLSNPNRLMILTLLGKGDLSVGQLAKSMDVPLPNVSQHLRILKQNNVVRSRKEGQTVYYSLADERMIGACEQIRSVLIDSIRTRGAIADGFDQEEVIVED